MLSVPTRLGGTMRTVLTALSLSEPARLVLAVPVAPPDTLEDLAGLADEIVCLKAPDPFHAVGAHFEDFSQTSDAEVVELLSLAHVEARGGARHEGISDETSGQDVPGERQLRSDATAAGEPPTADPQGSGVTGHARPAAPTARAQPSKAPQRPCSSPGAVVVVAIRPVENRPQHRPSCPSLAPGPHSSR